MRQGGVILCAVTVLSLACGSRVLADDTCWCSDVAADHPLTIVCEDFDRYCGGVPPWPGVCAVHTSPYQLPFLEKWPEVVPPDTSGSTMKPYDEYKEPPKQDEPKYADSWPYTGRFFSGSNNSGSDYLDTQHTRDLRPLISAIQPGKNIVKGTDDHPLILAYAFNFHEIGQGREFYQNHYIDLSLNDWVTLDRAPTDHVMSEDCAAVPGGGCGSFHGYPIICQQNNPSVGAWGCPSLSILPIHASIAVGVLSWLDTNPCHCGESVAHAASNWHLAFFDGKEWWTLKHGVPGSDCGSHVEPIGSSPMPPPDEIKSPGDFSLSANMNYIKLTIKTSTVQVELWYVDKIDNDVKYHVHHCMTVTRQYLGAFNNIAMGTGKGCELDANGNCIGERHLLGPNGKGGAGDMDSLALVDGELDYYTNEGACCKPNGTCVIVDQPTCEAQGGFFWGPNTICDNVLCCPIPFADSDRDGDVDQVDFGAWQLCYTGPGGGILDNCDCWDRPTPNPPADPDGDVDNDDFVEFNNCWTGPNVPYSVALPPSCEP